MSKKDMPKPDAALKDFFKDNDIFAAVFNGYFFGQDRIIDAAELQPVNTAYSVTVDVKGRKEVVNRYRDNIRKTSNGSYLVILGIENQSRIHYSMPVRKMLYDALEYCSEIAAIGNVQDKKEWTINEQLSNASRGTVITPVITIVFYTGEEAWDGPRSLHDMMEMDERFKEYVPDYPLFVIDLGHDQNMEFPNESLESLKDVLSSIYDGKGYRNESFVSNGILALAGILAGDKKLYEIANRADKGGKQIVCKALQKRDEMVNAELLERIAASDARAAESDARAIAAEARADAAEKRLHELEILMAAMET